MRRFLFSYRWALSVVALFLVLGMSYRALRPSSRKHHYRSMCEKLAPSADIREEWELPPYAASLAQARDILRQPFFYLGKGRQCYAFESEDGQYVLKFLKYTPATTPKMKSRFFAKKVKKYQAQKQERKLQRLGNSLKIAYLSLPEATGMLFLHLNPTCELPTITVVDKHGNPDKLDLNSRKFLIQKKGGMIKPEFISLMHVGDVEMAKRRIDQIFQLLVECAKRGIRDKDGALIRNNNLGFTDHRAIYIDTGKFEISEDIKSPSAFDHGLRKQLKPLRKWLVTYYPELAEYFDVRQEQVGKGFAQ